MIGLDISTRLRARGRLVLRASAVLFGFAPRECHLVAALEAGQCLLVDFSMKSDLGVRTGKRAQTLLNDLMQSLHQASPLLGFTWYFQFPGFLLFHSFARIL